MRKHTGVTFVRIEKRKENRTSGGRVVYEWKRDTAMSVEELILVEQFLQCVLEELAI